MRGRRAELREAASPLAAGSFPLDQAEEGGGREAGGEAAGWCGTSRLRGGLTQRVAPRNTEAGAGRSAQGVGGLPSTKGEKEFGGRFTFPTLLYVEKEKPQLWLFSFKIRN